MTEGGPDLDQIFRDEAAERLDEMDTALMAVESGTAGPEAIDVLFRHAHTIKGTAGFVGRDDVGELAHAIEDILGAVRDTGVFRPELAALLLKAASALRAQVLRSDQAGAQDMIAELSTVRASLAGSAAGAAGAGEVGGAVAEPGSPAPGASAPGRAELQTHLLRVPAEKIDHLLDVVAELTRYRQQLAQPRRAAAPADAEEVDDGPAAARMLDELADTAVSLRTLPLATISGPMPRVVRDLAKDAGKDVDLQISGADTELDRVVLDSLSEPIAHLLRNAVKHGIESPDERVRAGKPPRGRIELRAAARGSSVEVTVADDGKGVSPEVAVQARRTGSLADLLTRPGYSTAGEVTGMAGRGVGLDAVREYVRSFGGSLRIRSEPGTGTEVVLLLPLALSLMDVLLIERGGAVYGIPQAAVAEAITVSSALSLRGQPMVAVHDRPIPVADVAVLLGAAAPSLPPLPPLPPVPPLPAGSPALVILAAEASVAVACDSLLGQREVAVKPLGPLLAAADQFLGAAVLSDGQVALLIEPQALVARLGEVSAPAGQLPAAEPPPAQTILVVEDSFTARELQRSILETAGYEVVTARDGREALDTLGREPGIALVVTDLEMPALGGLELTRTIRADPQRSSLPVVVVTAHGSEEDVRKGIEAGADAYMAKRSFDQHTLLATVERLIDR
jgi:chemotaxis protein histidine kinase CheA/CheY-like chemotaxis protein